MSTPRTPVAQPPHVLSPGRRPGDPINAEVDQGIGFLFPSPVRNDREALLRAESLLLEHLGQERYLALRIDGHLEVGLRRAVTIAGYLDKPKPAVVRIQYGAPRNSPPPGLLMIDGKQWGTLCVRPTKPMPPADDFLQRWIILHADEDRFLQTAVLTVTQPVDAIDPPLERIPMPDQPGRGQLYGVLERWEEAFRQTMGLEPQRARGAAADELAHEVNRTMRARHGDDYARILNDLALQLHEAEMRMEREHILAHRRHVMEEMHRLAQGQRFRAEPTQIIPWDPNDW